MGILKGYTLRYQTWGNPQFIDLDRWENHLKSSLLLGFFQHAVLAARGLFFCPMRPMASPLKVVTRCHCQPQLQKKTWLDEVGCTGGLLCLGIGILVTSRSC